VSAAFPRSIEYGRQPRRDWKRRVLKLSLIVGTCCIVLAVTILLLGYLLLCYFFGEKRFSTRSARAVVTQVVNHTLVPSASGLLKLPPSMASISEDGNVYVTIDAAGTTWMLFPTWRGKGDNLAAYVYHSTPAAGPPPALITLNGPDVGYTQSGSTQSYQWRIGAAPIDYTVDRKVDANWYHVVFDMN